MVKRLIQHALVLAVLGLGLPQVIQAQDAINRSFATLELRPNDDLNMVVIPAGRFTMGSEKNKDEMPPHSVYVRSFLMGKTEVTQKQWQEVMGRNPSRFAACGPDCPVEMVSWEDVQQFIAKLNQKTGQKYRLPSEAEWEYAARAGSTAEWSYGNDGSKLGDDAWFGQNSGGKTHRVGQKLPNSFGLFDIHGNVAEWTQDCWHKDYLGAPKDGSVWDTGCDSDLRVLRGGSWFTNYPVYLRSGYRVSSRLGYADDAFGFRLARDF